MLSKAESVKTYNGIYDNLGIARAEAIREMLIRRFRVSALQIETDALATDTPQPFLFSILQHTPYNSTALNEAHYFENMTFSVQRNFVENSAVLQPSPNFLIYSDSLRHFLQKHARHSLLITSHTDKTENEDLGLKRAKTVAYFFEQLGIKNNITLKNAANSNPIAPNTTEEGKAKNRRINVSILGLRR